MFRSHLIFLLFVVGFTALGHAPCSAQQTQQRFSVAVDAAAFQLQVWDDENIPMKGLKASDFQALQRERSLPIIYFQEETSQEVSLALLLDVGPAMDREMILKGKELIFELIHLVQPEDEILIGTFDEEVYFLSEVTTSRPALLNAISNISPEGRRSKFQLRQAAAAIPGGAAAGVFFSPGQSYTGYAVDLSLLKLREKKNKAVLVISAGLGNLGEATLDHLLAAEARLFALHLGDIWLDFLNLGAESTVRGRVIYHSGGTIYQGEDLLGRLHEIRDSLKHFYLVACEPGEKGVLAAEGIEFQLPRYPELLVRAHPWSIR